MLKVPYGCCHCGCGEKTSIIEGSCRSRGLVRGEPRLYVHGHNSSPNVGRKARPVDERFREKIKKTDLCWFWTGTRTSAGYGYLVVTHGRERSELLYAHRLSHEFYLGPIAEGLVIDHLCRNKACVNPDHLEAVTQGENVRRGEANRGPQSHCNRGHEMAGENLYVDKRGRHTCRECSRIRNRRYAARKRAVAA